MPTVIISDNTTGRDFTGTADSQINNSISLRNNNYGTNTTVAAHNNDPGGSDIGSVFIKFTGLSNITGPVTVSGAALALYLSSNFQTTGNVEIYRLLRDWTEAGVTAVNYNGTNAWTSVGALGSGDVAASPSHTLSINTTAGYKSFSSSTLDGDVQGFINGTFANYGWIIVPENRSSSVGPGAIFVSKEGTNAQRPKLTVPYAAPGSTCVVMTFGV